MTQARKLHVLCLEVEGSTHGVYELLLDTVGDRHNVLLFDRAAAAQPQFAGIDVVVDEGGSAGDRGLIDCAVASGVKLWQVLGTGVDHVEVAYIADNGLALANTPGIFSADALAEHALMLMLSVVKDLGQRQESVRSGRFDRPLGDELQGKTLGLVGVGSSGLALAKRAAAFGMSVIGVDVVQPDASAMAACGVESCRTPSELPWLLARSDIISIHIPLTSHTRHLIDRRGLAQMRESAVLVNVARGAIVDEAALVDALRDGRLRGAGLDVFEDEPPKPSSPLLALDNVVVTPHIAGATHETMHRRADAVGENIDRVARDETPLYLVATPK